MGKTKEQCLNIISKQFSTIKENKIIKEKLLILEESIKEIVDSEYSLVWKYDALNNRITHADKMFLLGESILSLILKDKKVFFDNHITSHKNYNEIIDNPLNIQIKSMLILPIIKNKVEVLGFLVAYNSLTYGSEFQRYDTRCISFLSKHAGTLLEEASRVEEISINKKVSSSQKKSIPKKTSTIKQTSNRKKEEPIIDVEPIKRAKNEDIAKKNVLKKRAKPQKTKKDLEQALEEQSQKIKELEALLLEEKKPKQEIVVVEEAEEIIDIPNRHENHDELQSIIGFLKNELSYFSEKQNAIYTFLEIIKNSLHNQKQFEYLENQLQNSNLINTFVDTLQNEAHMPLNIELFKSYETLLAVSSLYTKVFLEEELFFNVFIDPKIPSKLLGDSEKIQSLLVHLFNNINCLIHQYGRIEFSVEYNNDKSSLNFIIKGLPPLETRSFLDFLKKKKINNSLTTNNSGLGLSVVSNLIKILNGKLKLTTEENGIHAFIVSIPCTLSKKKQKRSKVFKAKKPLKIAILMSKEDEYAYYNLRRYLESFDISKENITIMANYKKLEGQKFSHLFCFEGMLSDKIDVSKIPSISVLRHSAIILEYDKNITVNELYLNNYYGMTLQKILFPNLEVEEINSNTVLLQCNFVKKNKEKKRKELNAYVGQLRGFKA